MSDGFDIHKDPRYKAARNKIDDAVSEWLKLAMEIGVEQDPEARTGMMTGWYLAASISAADEDGEYDDLITECMPGQNAYMSLGIVTTAQQYAKDGALGMFDGEED